MTPRSVTIAGQRSVCNLDGSINFLPPSANRWRQPARLIAQHSQRCGRKTTAIAQTVYQRGQRNRPAARSLLGAKLRQIGGGGCGAEAAGSSRPSRRRPGAAPPSFTGRQTGPSCTCGHRRKRGSALVPHPASKPALCRHGAPAPRSRLRVMAAPSPPPRAFSAAARAAPSGAHSRITEDGQKGEKPTHP